MHIQDLMSIVNGANYASVDAGQDPKRATIKLRVNKPVRQSCGVYISACKLVSYMTEIDLSKVEGIEVGECVARAVTFGELKAGEKFTLLGCESVWIACPGIDGGCNAVLSMRDDPVIGVRKVARFEDDDRVTRV